VGQDTTLQTVSDAVTGAFSELAGRFGLHVGVLYAFAGFLVGVLVALAVAALRHRSASKRKDLQVVSTLNQFLNERQKSDAILADLDIGILAYASDGRLFTHNAAALKMLGLRSAPPDFDDFLARYGENNGLRVSLLLGTAVVGAVAHVADRQIRIRLKETRVDQERKPGTIAILQDITEQEREEKKRKDFVSDVSHEIRTPLTTIKTYSESLLEWGIAEKDKDGIRNDVWRIHEDSLRMDRLVGDLLLLSSIDSGRIKHPMEMTDMGPLVRQTVDRMQVAAKEKGLQLTCYTVARLQMVFVDRSKVERIVTNLVSNAIKYTEKGGRVAVYVGLLMNDVYVKVADTGVGIDQENLPKIFDRFYRVDRTGSRMFGGTGLGLSIAKELAELHGGAIEISSTLGKGTSAVFRVPIAGSVFKDALELQLKGGEATSPLQRAALEELTARAVECRLVPQGTKDLTGIDAETAGKVIAHAIGPSCEDEDPEAAAAALVEGKG